MADAAGGAQVGSERRLTVGSRRHEVEPPARAEDAGAEAGNDVSALVFKRYRWHRDEDVVCQLVPPARRYRPTPTRVRTSPRSHPPSVSRGRETVPARRRAAGGAAGRRGPV